MKEEWERAIDILYKYLESKVAGVDDITPDKVTILHAIVSNYKCGWTRYIYGCLVTFIQKVGVQGSGVIRTNVGYGFLISELLRVKGIKMSKGVEINPQTYLFRTTLKGTKKKGVVVKKGSEEKVKQSDDISVNSN